MVQTNFGTKIGWFNNPGPDNFRFRPFLSGVGIICLLCVERYQMAMEKRESPNKIDIYPSGRSYITYFYLLSNSRVQNLLINLEEIFEGFT